jgi:1-deoxy-D-xylulose-5-phosphate reductoisomerase
MKTLTNIAILGATGSIGRSSLEVISNHPDRFRVTYLTAHQNVALLREQIARFHPRGVVVMGEKNASSLRHLVDSQTEVLVGDEGLLNIVTRSDVDIVINSLVGFAGLLPTLRAIEAGKDIALANKETLVVAGEIVMAAVRKHGVSLLPIDSEHSAILQCLQGEDLRTVARLILTASGGPFLHVDRDRFHAIRKEDALKHPTWKMGSKITIDSATLMNKGLEVIEAHWLFGLPPDQIDIVVHPQSIIHSMVEFVDGSVKAQLGIPDMKLPIQYALMYPERPPAPYKRVNFPALREMTFFEPDREKFGCVDLAYRALQMGRTAPTVLNAANEVAVDLFLQDRIPFTAIPELIEDALTAHTPADTLTLDAVMNADRAAREHVRSHTMIPQ